VGGVGMPWSEGMSANAFRRVIKSIEERKLLTHSWRCSITNLQPRIDFHDCFYIFIW
jgi:hypothetical protein